MWAIDLLRHLADDNGTSRVGELAELAKVFFGRAARAGAFEGHADEERALFGRGDVDR